MQRVVPQLIISTHLSSYLTLPCFQAEAVSFYLSIYQSFLINHPFMADSSVQVQGEYKAMLALKPVTNLIAPQIQLGSGSPLRASIGPNLRSNSGFYLNLSGGKAKGSAASADLFGGGGGGGSSNRPDPLLDLDRVPLPLPPISFEGRAIVRVERNRHYSPLARAFLPYYLFDDTERQYLVITGNRQLCEAAQFQFQLPIVPKSARALPPNIFSVATTDGVPAGRLYLFGNKLTLLATQEDQDQEQEQAVESSGGSREKAKEKAKAQASKGSGSGRVGWFGLKRVPVPVPIVLRFVEIKGIAQPQPQSNP
jgi:hypothetical protein